MFGHRLRYQSGQDESSGQMSTIFAMLFAYISLIRKHREKQIQVNTNFIPNVHFWKNDVVSQLKARTASLFHRKWGLGVPINFKK